LVHSTHSSQSVNTFRKLIFVQVLKLFSKPFSTL